MLALVLGGIPNGLVALLGKVIGKVAGQGAKGDVKGMKADKADPKNEKGAPLGDPGGHLLHGVGYATKDARSQLKNKVEEANVNRFLEAQQDGKEPAAQAKTGDAPGTEKREGELVERKTEAQETRENRDKDVRREDHKDETRMHGRQELKEQEQRDQREGREKERQQHREQEERDDDENKHGHAWVLEAAEEEELPRRHGLQSEPGVYTDTERCKGALDDGSRCIRKPVKGIGYCREHAVNWRPDVTPKA
jgi:hypothetical protein